jgi:hypothetical protein
VADTLLAVRGIENLSPAGRRAVVDVARSLGVDPDWLATVMAFESAGTFSTSKKNAAGSGATGLIQFMPSTAGNLGYTITQLAAMSQEEQIRGPVFKYFANKGHLKSLDDVYLAVFYPSAIGMPDSHVIASEGSKVYEQNAGFDPNHTGQITKGAIVSTIHGVYNAAGGRRVDVPDSPFSSPSSSSPDSVLLPSELSIGGQEEVPAELSSENSTLPIQPLKNCWGDVLDLAKGIWERL